MSNSTPPRDRTPLYIAIVGATATVLAALIGVLPTLLNSRSAQPTAIVFSASPIPTASAGAVTALPTEPRVSATQPAGLAGGGTPAVQPTFTSKTTLLLVNNLKKAMDFYVDGGLMMTIQSGEFQPLEIQRGAHEFRQCINGTDQSLPANCFAKNAVIQDRVDYWEMLDDADPLYAQYMAQLLVLNQTPADQDIYINGNLVGTVGAFSYHMFEGPPGDVSIQPCGRGLTPSSGTCGGPYKINILKKTDTFRIKSASS